MMVIVVVGMWLLVGVGCDDADSGHGGEGSDGEKNGGDGVMID